MYKKDTKIILVGNPKLDLAINDHIGELAIIIGLNSACIAYNERFYKVRLLKDNGHVWYLREDEFTVNLFRKGEQLEFAFMHDD